MKTISRYQRQNFINCIRSGIFTLPDSLHKPQLKESIKVVVLGLDGLIVDPIVFAIRLFAAYSSRIQSLRRIRKYTTNGMFDYFKMRRVGRELYEKEHATEIQERAAKTNKMWEDIFLQINKKRK